MTTGIRARKMAERFIILLLWLDPANGVRGGLQVD